MSLPFGQTRTHIAARHAFIAPDSHVPSFIPGLVNATPVVLIAPALGAEFTQILLTFQKGGRAEFPSDGVETALYVEEGKVTATVEQKNYSLKKGSFLFVPATQAWSLTQGTVGTRLTLFSKRYEGHPGTPPPSLVVGHESKIKGQPFLGDPDARLQVLLPDHPSFDLAMNIFSFVPGATLPFVETHIMEHGFLMLEGQGLYRLEESWYPIQKGDALWMGPYCPQWFAATGKKPARYLYYKNVNRIPRPA
jgi:(S)-ureidoglycine aminohydrolase